MASIPGTGFYTQLQFFKDDELYKYEKPYGFKFPPEDHPHTNIRTEKISDVYIEDIRGREETFNIKENGFAIRTVNCTLSYEDYHTKETVQPYFRELEGILQKLLGATTVEILRYQLRKRHVSWPRATESLYEYDQPTTVVHVDATMGGLRQEVEMKHGTEIAEKLYRGRVQWFNVWKPIRTPINGLNDWPLLFSDAALIDKSKDLTPADLVYPTYATENTQVYYRSNYKWYYLSGHQTNEIIIFKQADSDERSCAGKCLHHPSYRPMLTRQ